jgi:glycosyltransferase involved in cell wall biosynthesis
MLIGFDAKRIYHNETGLGNNNRLIIKSLLKHHPENAYMLFSPLQPVVEPIETKGASAFYYKGMFPGYWRSFGIKNDLIKNHIDIFHGLSNEIPFTLRSSSIKSVVTIHDVIFRKYPHQYAAIDRMVYNFKTSYACKYADKIIAASETTKNDIIHYFGTNPQKIEVVYQSCDERYYESTQPDDTVLNSYNLPSDFVLYVGSIIERKNLLGICKAYTLLPQQSRVPCIVIGRGGAYVKTVKKYIEENQLEKYFIFLTNVTNAELPAFYKQATLSIYPAFYEGFGLPVLESMASGCPVITSSVSSLAEVAGNACILTKPDNAEELAHALSTLIHSETDRKKFARLGKLRAQQFTAEKCIKGITDVYKVVKDM